MVQSIELGQETNTCAKPASVQPVNEDVAYNANYH